MPLNPQQVHQRLQEAARRLRWARCVRFLLSGMVVGLTLLTLFLLADGQFHFGSVTRWIAFLLVVGPLLAGLALSFRAALPHVSEESIARRIETAADGSRNTLISAVQFDKELAPNSGLRKAIFEEMRDPFPQVDWSLVFDLGLLKRLALGLGSVLLLMGLFAALRPLYFSNSAARILLPGRVIAPLTRTRIATLTPGDTRVINGRELFVSVRLEGQIPKGVWLHSREAGGRWERAIMDHEIGSTVFTCAWKEVREPFVYWIEAGDAVSPVYQVAVRPRTALVARKAEIESPAYTRLPKESRREFASLQGLVPGSRVMLSLEFNHPIEELHAIDGMTVHKISATAWNVSGVIKANTVLKLDYRDGDGIADSETLQIATAPDEAPRITITTPSEGKEIFATKEDALIITFNATDNFGLESVALFRTSEEHQEAEQISQWKDAAGKKSFAATLKVPLAKYARENRVTLALVAKDQNDVSGPGVTWSRPLVVTLRSQEQVKEQQENAGKKAVSGLETLIKLQAANLEGTQAVLGAVRDVAVASAQPQIAPLMERQSQITETARALAASAESIPSEARANLQALVDREMPEAILFLRTAVSGSGNDRKIPALAQAVTLEAAILARLQGALKGAENAVTRGQIQDILSSVEELLRSQREVFRDTQRAGAPDANPLSERQDALAGKAVRVRKSLEKAAQDGAIGDQDFRNRLTKAAALFGEMKIYEQMLAAAEHLQNRAFSTATTMEQNVIASLAKLVEMLNQWQLASAEREAGSLKKAAREMADKLDKLAQIQREVVEKSKEIARKAAVRPEDIAAAEEMKKGKDLMAGVVEQMLIDAHVFPDLKPANELRGELTQIYEDVIQTDQAEAAAGQLKASEILVQKEDNLLKAIEEAKKVAEDLEMWLPNKNDTTKWLCENFDKTEMPDIPNLPLPDAFEDLVGDLLKEQEGLAEQAQDAASNQAFAQAQQGWGVADGPMPGFSAQGKSGNTRPKKNEQTGRSSGGREGMSDGEMVGDTASTLEGSKPDVRRTNDPMQQGHINDDHGIQEARATGGGKAGGFSDRNGMDGNAPLRASNALRMTTNDVMAIQQALLAEKTAKTYGQANLLYLRAKGLPEVVQMMDQSQAALKEGRMDDFRSLHQKIVTQLSEVKGGIFPGNVVSLTTGDAPRAQEKQLLGGDEGQAPPAYQKAVVDYYRSLQP